MNNVIKVKNLKFQQQEEKYKARIKKIRKENELLLYLLTKIYIKKLGVELGFGLELGLGLRLKLKLGLGFWVGIEAELKLNLVVIFLMLLWLEQELWLWLRLELELGVHNKIFAMHVAINTIK